MKLTKNQEMTLEVADMNHLGFGVAKPDGFAVFVGGAVTGDKVRAKIIKVNKSYAVARTEEILVPSPMRVDRGCPSVTCTACVYKNISYEYEKTSKRNNVVQAFRKAGLSDVPIGDLLSTGQVTRYRNKAQFPVARGKDGRYIIGFYAPKSHRVCEAAACPLQPTVFRDIVEVIRAFLEEHRIPAYDEESGDGWIRHIYLRRGEVTGEILLTLVVTSDRFADETDFVRRITETFPAVVGILLNIQKENTNVVLGKTYRTLYGKDSLTDILAGVRLKLTAPAFYQVNHAAAELLYRKAAELAAPQKSETLLDLYCGAGSIGLSMAHAAGKIIGIEIVKSAVRCAKENAAESGITNAEFFTGDAVDTEKLLSDAERSLGQSIRPDIVVLDPPRAGCDEKLLTFVAGLSPSRIVYISCNPETLARDAAVLKTHGYICGTVTPVDLFPGTGHVETIVLLQNRNM